MKLTIENLRQLPSDVVNTEELLMFTKNLSKDECVLIWFGLGIDIGRRYPSVSERFLDDALIDLQKTIRQHVEKKMKSEAKKKSKKVVDKSETSA